MLPLVLTLLLPWVSAYIPERTEEKIIGGQTCVPHSQPWQAAQFVLKNFHCGVFLVSNQWALTAAHCNHWNLRVVLGKHNIYQEEPFQQSIRVKCRVTHPKYSSRNLKNDLMLLYLENLGNLTPQVGPIQLAEACATPRTACQVSGWGTISSPFVKYPSNLQCAEVSILSMAKCNKSLPLYGITPGVMCAGTERGGKDACPGDSGGPLVCNGTLQGIVSWGMERCGLARYHGVYTNLCLYRTWILKEMQKQKKQ
ncbi:LOW QUALITY PROTEIN: kallikrein-14-like [Dromiciops gliroides]|uniref:LOW QUALITY PROTEIN: kallikrein-14-like n=1 Tax=Dromiciops gliroides TaxID=33562 RepID=UPI001CC3B52F|nr:LOW QUALITY PROTEIN: kallikrein-14-like [Dromiciops gliroides]